MERMEITLDANHTMNEQPVRRSNSSTDSQDRMAAIAILIQQTRSLNSLPLSAGDELAFALSTWSLAVEEIPDRLLGPSWELAVKNHDWARPFSPMSIRESYKLILIEDRERREKDRYRTAKRGDDLYACPFCQDTGYTAIAIYCGSFKDWHKCARACECNATPINQRKPRIIGDNWVYAEDGRWYPPSTDQSPACLCAFCKNRR